MILRGANLPGLDPSYVSPDAYAVYLDTANQWDSTLLGFPFRGLDWSLQAEDSAPAISTQFRGS
jgi:hypothetical protein